MSRGSNSSPPPPLPPFCDGGPGLHLELALRQAEPLDDTEDPFVALGEGGRVARVLLGRVALGAATIRPLAFKLRRDSVFAPTQGFGNAMLGNREIDAMWAREAEHLAALDSPAVVGSYPLGDPSGDASELPPITFCRHTRAYFHPPAPSGGRLQVCRADELLRECGLQPYSSGTTRYLFDPTAVDGRSADRKLAFYTVAPPGQDYPQADVDVRRGAELYRDLGTVVHGDHDAATSERLAASFPCLSCEHREECYPREADPGTPYPAEARLVPVTYYDSPVLAVDVCELRYSELVDVLGGAEWSEVEPHVHGPGTSGRRQISASVAAELSQGRQYFASAADPKRPMEVLALKLGALRQVCAGLQALHARQGAPYFDVSPGNVMASFAGPADGIPARWQFRVRLTDLGAAQPYRPPAAAQAALPEVWIPVADVDRDYLSPFIARSSLGRDYVMRFTVADYVADGDSYRVRVEARSASALLDGIEVGDLLYLQPNAPVRQLTGFDLVARVTRTDYRALDAELTLPNTALPESWSLPFAFDGIAVAYPQLGPACDLHGLGLLLFRALFVNDRRNFGDMLASVRRVLEKLELELSSITEPDATYAGVTLRRLLREEGQGYGCEEILYRAEARESAEEAVSAGLWGEIVSFGFRLLSSAAGFGFATHHGTAGVEQPTALIAAVLDELDRFRSRIDVELFGQHVRDEEVSSLCEAMILELSEDMVERQATAKIPKPKLDAGPSGAESTDEES